MKEALNRMHCHRKAWKWIFHLFVFTICIILLVYRTSEWLQAYHLLLNDHKVNRLSDYFLHHSNFNEVNMISDHTTPTTDINSSSSSSNNNNNHNNKNTINQHMYIGKTNSDVKKDKQNATIILCNINPISIQLSLGLLVCIEGNVLNYDSILFLGGGHPTSKENQRPFSEVCGSIDY
ncbi:unnamed protein product [Trichobilharzia szidati]|nr:unnamed protein product [Trichobilharzia szidati]